MDESVVRRLGRARIASASPKRMPGTPNVGSAASSSSRRSRRSRGRIESPFRGIARRIGFEDEHCGDDSPDSNRDHAIPSAGIGRSGFASPKDSQPLDVISISDNESEDDAAC